jgi:5'-3' exonuclease
MGIPSYFFQLMKRHKQIVSSLTSEKVDNLYLDSNSIIYDVVHSITDPLSKHEFEEEIISRVCLKILSYLQRLCPSRVFIAFDGVPPMAKMKQQRERRYKGWLTSQWLNEKKPWDTVQITPGTAFMKRLDQKLVEFFEPYRSNYAEFHLSTSSEAGEGEHKLFSFIRDHPDKHISQHTMIYGLDSDLIILSLNHLYTCQRITLLREAPAFNLKEKDEKELTTLDINQLSDCITEIMGKDRLQDYIFMTLLLGNDFMPHFPALNLRTTGMDTLLNTYVECMQDKPMMLGTVQWDNVRHFITALSRKEHRLFMKEQATRNNRNVDNTTLEKRVNNMPMLKREKEYIICPTKPEWQSRYYAQLFASGVNIGEVCTNYVQMLEWNIRYYTTGCCNWTLYYHYAYPPLLEDLAIYIPSTQTLAEDKTIVTSNELLAFVLPPALMFYLDTPEKETSKEKMKEPTLIWAYCTYLWEAHVQY